MGTIQPVTLLKGHVSPETAYVIEDYPYGSTLRCRKRAWIETATKGAKKGQRRLVTQTTNPKRGHAWNKPHPGQYSLLLWMYLDPETGHLKTAGISQYGTGPVGDAFLRLTGIYDQMDEERRVYDALIEMSKRPGVNAIGWERYYQLRDALGEYYRETGQIPAEDLHDGTRVPGVYESYVDAWDYKVALAELRQAVEAQDA